MPINTESLNKKLFDLLKSQGLKPIPLDAEEGTLPVEDEADVFKFAFPIDDGKQETVYATIDQASNLKLYYDDDVFSSYVNASEDNNDWIDLIRHLKYWALRNQLRFDLTNKDHLANDMAKRAYMRNKENIAEGYYPMGKSASYTNDIPSIKIILQHTRQIQEGEQRFRNIAKIFLENTEGERILAPTTRPGLARIYARHLAEGGVPNDERWNHIKGLCEEYGKMAGFVRATKNRTFNESATGLIQEGLNHYNNLRETLGKLTGHRGYTNYFESWTPALMEDESEESTVNELFVQETLDPRIESVMPILNKLQKKINEMSEVNELESWADNIIENSLSEGHRYSDKKYVCVHAKKGKAEVHAETSYEAAKKAAAKWGLKSTAGIDCYLADTEHTPVNEETEEVGETKKKSSFEKFRDSVKKKTGYDMDKGSRNIDDIIKRLKELEKEYNYSDKKVNEAPGAETLAHNDETEQSNLKAFDLAEGARSSHEDPLVVVYDKDGLHTHANLSTVNHIFNINVDAEDVHKGPVIIKSGWEDGRKIKIKLSKHHKADDAFGASPADRLSVREQGVAEGVMSEIDMDLRHIGRTESFDALQDAIDGQMGRATQQYLQDMMMDIARDNSLHYDDDMDRIMEILMDRLVEQYGVQVDLSEGEFAGNFKTGPAGQWRNKGPKAHKPATVGDLVGASESIERDPLDEIKRLMGK